MDIIKPFMLEDGLFRGALVSADQTIEQMLSCHGYPEYIKSYLGQLAVLGLFLASSIKYDGSFAIQVKGTGTVKSLIVEISHELHVKGYALFDADDKTPKTIGEAFGDGHLIFSIMMTGKEPHQGIVELSGNSLTDTVLTYFTQSEQIPTSIVLREQDGKIRGIFVQQMPSKTSVSAEEQTDLFETISVLMHSVKNTELFSDLSANDILFRLFHANKLVVFDERKPSFFCACYPEKFKNYLKKIPSEQLDELYENGCITTQCEYCGQKYTFEKGDLS